MKAPAAVAAAAAPAGGGSGGSSWRCLQAQGRRRLLALLMMPLPCFKARLFQPAGPARAAHCTHPSDMLVLDSKTASLCLLPSEESLQKEASAQGGRRAAAAAMRHPPAACTPGFPPPTWVTQANCRLAKGPGQAPGRPYMPRWAPGSAWERQGASPLPWGGPAANPGCLDFIHCPSDLNCTP